MRIETVNAAWQQCALCNATLTAVNGCMAESIKLS
jgi:hypothetical protein